jgi:hypothetical protein
MSYQFVEFDGVPLPLYEHNQNHDTMPSEPTLLDSVGGAYDWRGDDRRVGRKQIISGKGIYFGELTYLVDENGDQILDESDDPILVGDAPTMLAADVRALMEKKGVRGPLWRKRLVDDVMQWKTARLLAVIWPRKWEDHGIYAEVNYQFETQMEFWHEEDPIEATDTAVSGVPKVFNLDCAGMTVEDAVITITRTSGTITTVAIEGVEIDILWTGSLGASAVLEIDCGLQTVRKNGVDSYSGFSLESGHTAAGWMPLLPGTNAISVTVTGGNATVDISYYDQFV